MHSYNFLYSNSLSIDIIKVQGMLFVVELFNRCCSKSKPIRIKIVDIKRNQHEIIIDNSYSIGRLKTYIYQNLCKSLSQGETAIENAGKEVDDMRLVSSFKAAQGENLPIFYQEKIGLNKLQDVVSKFQQDLFLGQQVYMAKMPPCNHYISRESLIHLIRSQISENYYQIKCPNINDNGDRCAQTWDFKMCKKIGAFTIEERTYFQDALNMNWMKKFAKKCPNCELIISKGSIKTNKVRCPSCKSHDFCYICLLPWKSNDQKFCGSQTCQFYNNQLLNTPWDRIFDVKDKKTGKIVKISTPKTRMCPFCTFVIQNYANCKHTHCPNCKKSFCWICLEVKGDNWKCGVFSQYCGNIAGVQSLKT